MHTYDPFDGVPLTDITELENSVASDVAIEVLHNAGFTPEELDGTWESFRNEQRFDLNLQTILQFGVVLGLRSFDGPQSETPCERRAQVAEVAIAAIGNEPMCDLGNAEYEQRYANLYVVLQRFLVDALEAGVDAEALFQCVFTDVDQTIAMHEGRDGMRQ